MTFEKRDATRLISFDPPLPRRGFPIVDFGSTTSADSWAGGGEDGRQYGRFTLDVSSWSAVNGAGVPPLSPGEKFQVYTWNGSNHGFLPSTGVPQYSSHGGSPDLYKIDYMFGNGAPYAGWILKTPDVRTVLGVKQIATNSWDVYFTPYLDDQIDTSSDGIVTFPEPMNGVWLGTIGHEVGLKYGYGCPGGPTSLTVTIAKPPKDRPAALNTGRIIQGYRGTSCIWEGELTEPVPGSDGWELTVDGVSTFGQKYGCIFDTALNSAGVLQYTGWTTDEPIDRAIGRGLRWSNDGIGKPSGIYLDNPQDPGTINIQDFLNQLTSGGSLYWTLDPPSSACVPAKAWKIRIKEFPSDLDGNPLATGVTAPEQWQVQEWQRIDLKAKLKRVPPDLYIINVNPLPRTVTNDYNTLIIKYQVSADVTATSTTAAKPAVTALTVVDNPLSVAAHGRSEYYIDMTSAGTKTETQIITMGQNILNQYVRANFSTSITVQPGQLVNNGGVAVDLGVNHAAKVATVLVENAPIGGEVMAGPITFLIGEYDYDEDAQTATITPYQNQKSDLSSVISQLYPGQFN